MFGTLPRVSLVFLVLHGVAWSTIAIGDEPIARWQFDAEHGHLNRFDPLAGSLDAVVEDPVRFSTQPPRALQLRGDSKSGQRIAVTDDLSQIVLPKQDITIEAWVKIDELLDWGGIVGVLQDNGSYEKGWLLGYRGSQFSFALAGEKPGRLTYLRSNRHFDPGNWYYVVGTYDGRLLRLFVDGELAGESTEQSGPIAYPPKAPFTIGAYHDDNDFCGMTGEIEQVSLWNKVLSDDQIAGNFEARKQRFPGIVPVPPVVTDWPTHLRDNQRTGVSDDSLPFPLKLQWVHQMRHPPKPAWPDPARQDIWHEKNDLRPRVTYDRVSHVVTVGDQVYFGTSADDRVVCLDAESGRIKWQFFAEGPVRLSPTIAGERVLFGSDDGFVYCLNAVDGVLRWKFRLGPTDRRIPGNERITSVWPVRTGVVVEDDLAYFCAGLFPAQGVYQAAVNINTGERVAGGPIDFSPQGYLELHGGRLHAPTGRDPAGALAARLQRRGKALGKPAHRVPNEFPYAMIGAGDFRLGGGDGKVAAFRLDGGEQLWAASVEGKAYGMAVACGRLFVSTDAGHIYCFSAGADAETVATVTPQEVEFPYPDTKTQQQYAKTAERILEQSNGKGGYCLVLGSAEGRLAVELAKRTDLKIVGVESDPMKVAQSRRAFNAAGLYGRIVIHQHDPLGELPYTDYLFNLVVCDSQEPDATFAGSRDEVLRVLRPHGGVAVLGPGEDHLLRRGPLENVGEWTHMYADPANTACSSDRRVTGRMKLQWFGPPGPRQMVDRHHRTVAPLSKNGRLFVPGNDRVIAVDAYNGTLLWNKTFPASRRVGVFRDCSYMVAADDSLYVATEHDCHEVEAATGNIKQTFAVPPAAEDEVRQWGYLACVDDLLLGSTVKPGASRRGHSKGQILDGLYYDSRPLVCSDTLFALDRATGKQSWLYRPSSGTIINSTIAAGDGYVYLVESTNPQTLETPNGRSLLADLLGKGSNVVALDVRDGSVAWSQPHDLTALQHVVYASYAQGKLVLVGSRNSGTDKEKSHALFDIHVLDARSGEPVWFTTQDQGTVIGGSHGEQDHHPVIAGDRLVCEPHAYELHTGKPLAEWTWQKEHRRGCGTISASASDLFFRQASATMFDLETNQYSNVTSVTRPGCWINMIPAGGLLLIPEASSGCTCNFAVQTSLAFLPEEASE